MIKAFCLPCKCLVLNIFGIGSHRSGKNKEVIVEISISFYLISNILIQESRKMVCLLCARCLVLETKKYLDFPSQRANSLEKKRDFRRCFQARRARPEQELLGTSQAALRERTCHFCLRGSISLWLEDKRHEKRKEAPSEAKGMPQFGLEYMLWRK